jgi:hypothetical protein
MSTFAHSPRVGPALLLGAALLFPVSGCSRKQQQGASAGAAASQQVAAAPAAVANIPASAMPVVAMPRNAGPLAGKLQEEAASRPNAPIKAEAVFALVQQKGIELHEIQQYMGSPIGAKYCAGAKTPTDVFLSVCEFQDPDSAAKGKEKSEAAFGALSLRQLVVNRTSLLTLRDLGKTPESAEQAKLLATTFASL